MIVDLTPAPSPDSWLVTNEWHDVIGKVAGTDETGWYAYVHVGRGRFRPRRNQETGFAFQHPTRDLALSWVTAQVDNG